MDDLSRPTADPSLLSSPERTQSSDTLESVGQMRFARGALNVDLC